MTLDTILPAPVSGPIGHVAEGPFDRQTHRVQIVRRAERAHCGRWSRAFAGTRKRHRFYELVEDTIRQGFDYRYFVIKDARGEVQAVQPFFILDQDLLAGSQRTAALIAAVRRVWPRFLKLRALMVGCTAGEGHLDGDERLRAPNAEVLAAALVRHAP